MCVCCSERELIKYQKKRSDLVVVVVVVDEEEEVTLEFVKPATDAIESSPATNIVDNESTDSAPVVSRGDGTEAFLAGGVPNLSFNLLGIDFQALRLELHPDGGFRVGVELVPRVPGKQV